VDAQTAERVVLNESKRQDQADILREAQRIVRQQRRAEIQKRGEAIQAAEAALELARRRIEQRTSAKLSTRLGSAASDDDVERFLRAKARLAELRETPLPEPGEAVHAEDRQAPVLRCPTDATVLRADGFCGACRRIRVGESLLPGHERSAVMDVLKRNPHGLA